MAIRLVEGHNAYKGKEVPYTLKRDRDGVPDFTAIDRKRVRKCLEGMLCGICGQRLAERLKGAVNERRLSRVVVFVGGEGSTRFNDPPNHPGCAARALRFCPFLRGERVRPDADGDNMILRDSGVYGAYICTDYGWDKETLQSWPVGPVKWGQLDPDSTAEPGLHT